MQLARGKRGEHQAEDDASTMSAAKSTTMQTKGT
jgi:hypothetical protein